MSAYTTVTIDSIEAKKQILTKIFKMDNGELSSLMDYLFMGDRLETYRVVDYIEPEERDKS
jgi:hypothetical protein